MSAEKWIKQAQKNGWVVAGVDGLEIRLRCQCHGCTSALTLPIQNLGPVPDRCAEPHINGYSRAAFAGYQQMVEELISRRRNLGLSQDDLNAASGMTEGYINKLESYAKIAAPPTLQLWADSLGVTFTIRNTTLPPATRRAVEARIGNPYQINQVRSPRQRTLLEKLT